MKIMLWSDPHFHNWPQLSNLEDGINSRLLDSLKVLEYLNKYCKKNKIKYRIQAGDLFHKRDEVSAVVITKLLEHFRISKDHGIKDYFLLGNHDLAFNTDYHSLAAFQGIVTIVTKPSLVTILDKATKGDWCNISFHPWNDDRMQWREDYLDAVKNLDLAMSIMHYDFNDINYRGVNIGSGVASSILRPEVVNFSGHYHDHKDYGSVIYIGSPMQHNWSDVNMKRGFIIVEVEDNKVVGWEHHEIEGIAPKFIVTPAAIAKNKAKIRNKTYRDNFVRVVSNGKLTEKERNKIKENLSMARTVEFYVESVKKAEDDYDDDIEDYAIDPAEILSSYVKDNKPDNLNEKTLNKIGTSLFEEVSK